MHNPLEKKVKPRHISRLRALRILILVLGLGLTAAIGATAGVIGAYYYVQPSLPAAETIRDIPLEVPLRIFSRDGYLISEIGERKRKDINAHVEIVGNRGARPGLADDRRIAALPAMIARDADEKRRHTLDRLQAPGLAQERLAMLELTFNRLLELRLCVGVALYDGVHDSERKTGDGRLGDGPCAPDMVIEKTQPNEVARHRKLDNGPMPVPLRIEEADGPRLDPIEVGLPLSLAEEKLVLGKGGDEMRRRRDRRSGKL